MFVRNPRCILALGALAVCVLGQPQRADAMRFHRHRGLLGWQRCAAERTARADVACCEAARPEDGASKQPPLTLGKGLRGVLEVQREVYDATVRLEKLAAEQPHRNLKHEARQLSVRQGQIAAEVEKWIAVLLEDGTTVVFPEALRLIHEDMRTVGKRLSQGKVEKITQAIQRDIIDALDDALSAVRK